MDLLKWFRKKKATQAPDPQNKEQEVVMLYFLNELDCTHVPQDILDYYVANNGEGENCKNLTILSLEVIKEELENCFPEFLNSFGYEGDERLIPFATDEAKGYYVFVGNKNDNTLYWLDPDFPDDWKEYTLAELVETEINRE